MRSSKALRLKLLDRLNFSDCVKLFTRWAILGALDTQKARNLSRRSQLGQADCAIAKSGSRPAKRNREMAKKNRSFSYSRSAKSLQENATNAGSAAGASYTLVGAILVLGGIGYGVDKWRGTAPWGLIIGLALGMIVGFYDLVKTTWRR
jgi:F0F1-type ATP synthase assembly protein I